MGQFVLLHVRSVGRCVRACLRVWDLWVMRTGRFCLWRDLVILRSNWSEINGILRYSHSVFCASSGQPYTNYMHPWLRQRYTRYRHPRPQASCFYSSLELVSSFVRYRLPGLLKLLLCYESCHRLISSLPTGMVAASSNLRQEIVTRHAG